VVNLKGVRLLTAGEQGLVVEFGDKIDMAVNIRVHRVGKLLTGLKVIGILEIVPTYRSLMVYFDPLVISRYKLAKRVLKLIAEANSPNQEQEQARVVDIPVCYGGDFGPDMAFVTEHTGLSAEEVVELHTQVPYMVYMLGFMPGFPYLGGMSERLATPRLEKPRTVIAAGSVGIAGSQTGFYPVDSPGGWQIIGRTPLKGFDPVAQNPFPFQPGDYLRFRSVTVEDFTAISEAVASGSYQPVISKLAQKGGGQF